MKLLLPVIAILALLYLIVTITIVGTSIGVARLSDKIIPTRK